MVTLDVTSTIFHSAISIARDRYDRVEGKDAGVRRDRASLSLGAGSRYTHMFSFSLSRARGVDGSPKPVSFPPTTLSAGAIASHLEDIGTGCLTLRRPDRAPAHIVQVASTYNHQAKDRHNHSHTPPHTDSIGENRRCASSSVRGRSCVPFVGRVE